MKKQVLIPLCTVIGIAVIGGGIWGVMKYTSGKTVIEVTPVSNLTAYYYGDENSTEGRITSNVTQEIYLMENQLVKEVYVQEGDQVSIGDKLMDYDTTLTELDLEAKKISLNKINLQIKDLNKQISNLKKGIVDDGGISGGLGQVPVGHVLTATGLDDTSGDDRGSGTTQPDNPGQTDPPQTDPSPTDPPQTDPPQTDPSPTDPSPTDPSPTDPPQTDPSPTDPPQTDPSPTDPSPTDPSPEPEPVPLKEKLDWDTEIKEEGTRLVVECESTWEITPEFIYKLMGLDKEGNEYGDDPEEDKTLTVLIRFTDTDEWHTLDGSRLSLPAEEYSRTTIDEYINDNGRTLNPPEEDGGEDFPGGGFDFPSGPVYTQEEINQMIKEKEQELASLQLSIKQTNLDIQKLETTLHDCTVTSTVNGVVKSAGDPEEGVEDGKPFMVVDSSEGLYLTGSVTELQLDSIAPGQKVSVMSWNSGMTFEAEITEISPYPSTGRYYGSNPNVSLYPFKAYIEDSSGLMNNEYVQISMNTVSSDANPEALYLHKAYILEEDGKSYVYVRDENEKLRKQEVVTGKMIYGSYKEIKSGLTASDYIAFPYGKGLRDGVKTKEQTDIYY